ncbi:hypothetical protein Goarm_004712, partial [Gossypium armourianum]|nr:hypothetical protein [Gossypium armourianum]
MATSVKNNSLPPSLISNLNQVLLSRQKHTIDHQSTNSSSLPSHSRNVDEPDCSKPLLLITNCEGIDSPGLIFLVQALLSDARFTLHVCAPQSDKSVAGHSLTVRETVAVCSVEISGATAFEVSGAVAAAREALICGVPSLCLSFDWKKDVSGESDLKNAADLCLPLISAAVRDIERGKFPESCLLNIEIPSSPLANKGFKLTRQSLWRSPLSWKAVSANRHPAAGQYLSNQQSLGIKLAQLSRDASAA